MKWISAITAIIAALSIAACQTDGGPAANLGSDLTYVNPEKPHFDHPRVGKDGLFFETVLDIDGYKGREIRVVAFSQNGKYLGSRNVNVPYEGTIWKKFQLFVPQSNLRYLTPETGFTIYVLSPDDDNVFIEKATYSRSKIRRQALAWVLKGYDSDAQGEYGQQEIRLTLDLHNYGHVGSDMWRVTLVRDGNLKEFPSSQGGPFRIRGGGLTVSHQNGVFTDIEVSVPYEQLDKLSPTEKIVLTPSVMIDGELYEGNVHFYGWAGGTLDNVEAAVRKDISSYDRAIDNIENRLKVLEADLIPEKRP